MWVFNFYSKRRANNEHDTVDPCTINKWKTERYQRERKRSVLRQTRTYSLENGSKRSVRTVGGRYFARLIAVFQVGLISLVETGYRPIWRAMILIALITQFKLVVERIKKKNVFPMTLISLILLTVIILRFPKISINGDGPKTLNKSIHFFGQSSKQCDWLDWDSRSGRFNFQDDCFLFPFRILFSSSNRFSDSSETPFNVYHKHWSNTLPWFGQISRGLIFLLIYMSRVLVFRSVRVKY